MRFEVASMGPMDVEFEWERDAKGYRLAEEAPQPTNAFKALQEPRIRFPEGFPMPQSDEAGNWHTVRNGGTLQRYRAGDSLDLIFREFVNTPTSPEGVKEFTDRWGQLVGGDEDGAEPVSLPIRTIRAINQFIDTWSEPENATRARVLEKALGVDGFDLGNLKVHLIFDRRTGAPRTQILVPDLYTALFLRMVEVLTSDTVLRRCAHCNALFTAGSGTDRRLDAKFCSDEHRVLFHRLKNASAVAVAVPDQPRRRGRPRRATA
jgi:hypothetical protein